MSNKFPFRDKKTEQEVALKSAIDVLRKTPTAVLLQSIEMSLNILKERGQEVRDFDNKEKIVQQVRLIGGKAYFLAAKMDDNEGGRYGSNRK